MDMADWISAAIDTFFTGTVQKLNEDIFRVMYSVIEDTVIQPTNPSEYITNFSEYLRLTQAFAMAMLTVFIIISVFRQISGTMYQGEKSIGQYVLDITIAGLLIFLLPHSVTKIMIPLNNLIIEQLGNIGVGKKGIMDSLSLLDSSGLGGTITFLILSIITSLSLVFFAVVGGIRYIETLLVILISPFFGLSVINGSEGIQIWSREAIAVVFTQSIHFLMLIFIGSALNSVGNYMVSGLLTIGAVAVAMKGPQILRQFLYRTGTSSAVVSGAGSVGRLAAMRMVFK
jgi:hypothetical protein